MRGTNAATSRVGNLARGFVGGTESYCAWTNVSQQDKTWVKFSTPKVFACVPSIFFAIF
jgi:hypothetical protein